MTTRVVVMVKMVMMGLVAVVAARSDHKKAVPLLSVRLLSCHCLDIAVRVRNDRYYVKLSLTLDIAVRVTNDRYYVKLSLTLDTAVRVTNDRYYVKKKTVTDSAYCSMLKCH